MHITTIALIISILGLLSSFVLVGIIPSAFSLILGIRLFFEDKTIEASRIVAISFVGVILPIIMYINTYGISFPQDGDSGESPFVRIITVNYERLGLYDRQNAQESLPNPVSTNPVIVAGEDETDAYHFVETDPKTPDDEMDPLPFNREEAVNAYEEAISDTKVKKDDLPGIFESLDSLRNDEKNKGGIISIAPSDDDMPSYGGLPVGTMLVAQYFREDDHNCNPVLVLRNETGDVCRYECVFTARDKNGNSMATSEKTVEVVRDKGVFVFEGRFDKRELGKTIPDSYEFLVSKRKPYEKDMSNEVSVYTRIEGTSAIIEAHNNGSARAKVDAYVLYFDNNELVDCMWMIPQNSGEVCIDPGSSATITGDAYYRFDRVETFYTAYEAVGGT